MRNLIKAQQKRAAVMHFIQTRFAQTSGAIVSLVVAMGFLALFGLPQSTQAQTNPPTDAYFNSVQLLLHLDGADAGTTFTDVKGHAITPGGTAQITTAQSVFGGAALADGSSGYLTTPAASELALGTNDFTIEMWVYPLNLGTGYAGTYESIISQQQFGTGIQSALAIWTQNGALGGEINTAGGGGFVSPSAALPLNTWSHIALVGTSSTVTLYLNGQSVGSAARGGAQNASTLPLAIGADSIGQGVFNGYIDEVRYTNGVARYTTNFTPAGPFPDAGAGSTAQTINFAAPANTSVGTPLTLIATASSGLTVSFASSTPGVCTVSGNAVSPLVPGICSVTATQAGNATYGVATPVAQSFNVAPAPGAATDPYFANVQLLLHMDGANGSTTITDVAGHAMTANGTAQISTAQSVSNGASLATGTTGYVTTPAAPEFALGSSDFTIETWVYPLNLMTGANFGGTMYQSIVAQLQFGTGSQSALAIWTQNGALGGEINTAGGGGSVSSTTQLPLNVWSHIALVGTSSTVTLYLNGQNIGSAARGGAQNPSTLPLAVGADSIGQGVFNGYIDEMRYTNGTARYTANFSPTAPFANAAAVLTGQSITFAAPGTAQAGTAITLAATASSGLTVTFASTTPNVCTVSGNTLTPLSPGTCTISATQAGNATYGPAQQVSQSLNVIPAAGPAVDPYFANVQLLLHLDGANGSTSFIDMKGHAIAANGTAQIGTAQAVSNGASFATGNGGYLTTPAVPELALGSNDFTVEAWVYPLDITTGYASGALYQSIVSQQQFGSMSQNALTIWLQNGALNGGITTPGNAQGQGNVTTTTMLPLNAWSHVAVVGNSSTVSLYLNGQSIGSVPRGGAQNASTLPLAIGADSIGQGVFNGYIDEVRYTNGVARYSANFTPTAPYSNNAIATLPAGGSANINLAAGEQTNLTFSAAPNDVIGITTTPVTTNPAGNSVALTVHNPDGSVLGSFNANDGASGSFHTPVLTQSGTYALNVNPGNAASAFNAGVAVLLPPTVSLTSPTPGNVTGDNFTLGAQVNVTGTSIAQVTYYNGTNLLGTATQSPYAVGFKDMTPGAYAITAQATDGFGRTVTSAPVNVNVLAGNGGAGSEVVYDIHTDQLNTPRMITDQNGNSVWQWDDTDAFGDNLPNQDPNGTGNQFVFNHRFPGQYYDVETGTHYNYFRDCYDPTSGRYCQSDPIGLYGGSFSTYSYVNGNPISGTDPLGLIIVPLGTPAQVAAINNALGTAASQSSSAAGLINDLQNSSTFVFVKVPNPGEAANGYDASNWTAQWNPDKDHLYDGSDPSDWRPSWVGLMHELIHAYHHTISNCKNYQDLITHHRLKEERATVGVPGGYPSKYTENGIRTDIGIPLRPSYESPNPNLSPGWHAVSNAL